METCYSFNNFAIDIEKRSFSFNQQEIDFPEKSFDLLAKLLQAENNTLSKNILLEELWEGLVVSEWSLSRLVSDTRQILHEYEPDQEIIQTLRGKGFRIHPSVLVSSAAQSPVTESNTQDSPVLEEVSSSRTKLHSSQSPKKMYLFGLVSLIIVVTIFYVVLQNKLQKDYSATDLKPVHDVLNQSIEKDGRLTVMPVQLFTNDDQDEWVEYGIMSMAIKYFKAYENVDVSSVSATLKTLNTITYDRQSENLFSQVCYSLGCTQLLLLDLSLDENAQPVLAYQVLSEGSKVSNKVGFVGADILESTNLLLEHALQQLITQTPERKPLNATYSSNSAANMDYAIGVSKLLHGDLESAQAYFTLALKREPTFIWAQIYQADLYYRQGLYDNSEEEIELITKKELDIDQKVYLALIRSNIAYDKGSLALSIDEAKAVLPEIIALDDKELLGSTYMNIGTSLQAMGELDEGLKQIRKARGLFREFGFKLREAQAIFNIGNTLWLKTLDPDLALDKYDEAARIFRKLGANFYLAFTKQMSGGVKISSKRYDLAKRDLNEAALIFKELGNEQSLFWVDLDLADIAISELKYAEGEKLALTAFDTAGELTYVKSHASGLLVVIYLNTQQLDKAKYYIEERDKHEWYDPRPVFSMFKASYAHANGDLKTAVLISNKLKIELGDNWKPGHQAFADVFAADLAANERSLFDYGANFPD